MKNPLPLLRAVNLINGLFITFLASFIWVPATIAGEPNTSQIQLIEKMRQGGLVIFMRHASTKKNQIDARPIDLKDCEKQRNLSDTGRNEALLVGQSFAKHSIPASEVISSPFCRCKDTAQLAFQSFKIDNNLFYSIGLPPEERKTKTAALAGMLSTIPVTGNRIIISHTSNLKEATGVWPKVEGAIYVFNPSNNQPPEFLGSIKPSDWKSLELPL
ncbi:MAG: histidine phosphatase family protein [Neptuniibacter sp.]